MQTVLKQPKVFCVYESIVDAAERCHAWQINDLCVFGQKNQISPLLATEA